MPETRTLREYLLSLTEAQRAIFLAAHGGGGQGFEAVVDGIRTPDAERAACRRVKQLFGVEIPTAEERAERLRRGVASEASAASAAAVRAADATERSAREAAAAAAAAGQALAAARRATVLAAVAVVVSLAALIVSLAR
jgi:hypothetical protein